MNKEMIIVWGLIIAVVIYVVVCFWAIVTGVSNTAIYKKKRKSLDIALGNAVSTYYRKKEYESCIYEIEIIFKEIVLTNNALNKEFPNVLVLLQNHLLRINTEDMRIQYNEIDIDMYKKCIQQLIDEYNVRNPLEQIKGTHHIIFQKLITYLEKGEIDAGKEVINSLAIEMKTIQDNLRENEKNSAKQDTMAKVGLGLSIIFGMMTFIQFFV